MDQDSAIAALGGLAHSTPLNAFRQLVRHEPNGLPTGALVEASGLTQSTFSTHLAVLAKAELVIAERHGRQQIQRANIYILRGLMLAGKLSFIEGARTVNGLAQAAGFDRLAEPFESFVAIDSETDSAPTGKARDLWDTDAVARHAAAWERSENCAKGVGEPACHKVLPIVKQSLADN